MTTEEMLRGLFEIRSWFGVSHLALSGGEPLMHDAFPALYEAASDLFCVILLSSGLGLSDRLELGLGRRPPELFVTSLYGLREAHDSFCGRRGAFDDAARALAFFRDAGVQTAVNVVCHRENLGEIPPLLDELRVRNLTDGVKLLALSPLGRARDRAGLLVDSSAWTRLVADLRRHVVRVDPQFGRRVEIEQHAMPVGGGGSTRPWRCSVCSDEEGVFSSCVHVDANGDIYPCVMVLRRAELRIGNIRDTGSIDLGRYRERVDSRRSEVRDRSCSSCRLSDVCAGGCLGYHLAMGRDYRCAGEALDVGCANRFEPLVAERTPTADPIPRTQRPPTTSSRPQSRQ
jgi:pyrroloquinoline quinone biosynthesis protein E